MYAHSIDIVVQTDWLVAVWSKERNETTRGWLRAAPLTLLCHLRNCARQPDSVRASAKDDHVSRGGASPTRRGRHRSHLQNMIDIEPHPLLSLSIQPADVHSPLLFSGTFSEPAESSTAAWARAHQPGLLYSRDTSPALSSPSLPNSYRETPPSSEHSSVPPSRRLSRSQTHTRIPSQTIASWASPTSWNATRQHRFENHITRLTVSGGLPLSWVDNANWIGFCQEFLPFASLPSRKVLTQRLIPGAANELRSQAKAAAKGKEATLQADGWTGQNNHHLIAVMISVDEKVY
jgi:hypothetical protein